jgi:aspartate aminotransferase-like enzyme
VTELRPRLWIPGPTEVRPELAAELARPAIGHRSGAMTELIERVDRHLHWFFGFDPNGGTRAAVHTSSASGLMEAALAGVDGPVLCLVNGAFSKRFADMCNARGIEHEVLAVPPGEAPDPQAAAERLAAPFAAGRPFAAMTCVANETATGVALDLDGLMGAAREASPSTLRIVDQVTLAGGQPARVDELAIDVAITGSQKALALPPGLALAAFSARYCVRAASVPQRGWYLDPLRVLEGHAGRKTPATPAVPLYYALARQLEDMAAGVLEGGGFVEPRAAFAARCERHTRMARRTLAWAAGHGLAPLASDPARASMTVSCLRTDGGADGRGRNLDTQVFLARLEARGHKLSNGYGDWKGRSLRIGHFGDHLETDLEQMLAAADEVLAGL